MITIHWDFSDGTEVHYIQGKLLGDNFTTHCLDFFNMDERVDDVVVLRSNGKKISRKNIQAHSFKEIRKSHNIHKMLVAGSFLIGYNLLQIDEGESLNNQCLIEIQNLII